MMKIDDQISNSIRSQIFNRIIDQRATEYGYRGFCAMLGERPKARAESRRENETLHIGHSAFKFISSAGPLIIPAARGARQCEGLLFIFGSLKKPRAFPAIGRSELIHLFRSVRFTALIGRRSYRYALKS